MVTRRQARAAIALAVVWGLTISGCTPQPEPAPSASATGFASDEEAFAAAEATYRAYVDALNRVDLADPRTFEQVYEWLDGEALDDSKKSFSQMHADSWTVSGTSEVFRWKGNAFDAATRSVAGTVCLDVSNVRVINSTGESVVPLDRPERQALLVEFLPRLKSPTGVAIMVSRASDEQC